MKDLTYLTIITILVITSTILIVKKQDAPEVKNGPVYRPVPDFTLWPEDGPAKEK